MMKTKKRSKTLLLTLATIISGTMLASCGQVQAKPVDLDNETIINFEDKDKIYNNDMMQIYDALVKPGDHNSEKIMNNIIDIYAQDMFGNFWTLKEAFDNNDAAAKKEILKKHKVYKESELTLELIYTQILYQVKSSFYSDVRNGKYHHRGEFVEEKFYKERVKEGIEFDENVELQKPHVVNGSIKVLETTNSDELNPYFKDLYKTYKNYINIKVLPRIYRNMLVSNYLYKENYKSLGQSYARKISVISGQESDLSTSTTKKLFKAYCTEVLASTNPDVIKEINGKYNFIFLEKLFKGVPLEDEDQKTMAKQIYDKAEWATLESQKADIKGWDEFEAEGKETIYAQSSVGGLVKRYVKIYDETQNYINIMDEFTENHTHLPQIGLEIKKNSIWSQSMVTSGWFTKSTIGTVIPESLAGRLFKMDVANQTDVAKEDQSEDYSMGKYVNGNFYLNPETYETDNEYPYLIEDGRHFYIVKVEDAVMLSKLDSKSSDRYYGDAKAEKIARSIALLLSNNDTYKNDSNKYYIKKMALQFHDQTVYEYFVKTFPEIFNA